MTLTALRDKADAKLVLFWQALVPKQDAYFAKHGKYFQLLITDNVVDGVDTTFEVRHPNDELHQVDVDFTFNSPVPFQLQIDEWALNEKAGYSATVTVELPNGDIYRRTRDSEQNDSGWEKFDPNLVF